MSSKVIMFIALTIVLAAFLQCEGFQLSKNVVSRHRQQTTMHFDEAGSGILASDAAKGERYIATNRFKVKPNQGPKFEKRWADRKSRLSELEGFRFFTLLKRIEENGQPYEGPDPQYISFTTWENKDNFDAWRQGDAFKEAHGGTGFAAISGFVQLLTTALFILEGGPKPAFYDGLLPVVSDASTFSPYVVKGGWRKVEADGVNFLTPDVFVAQNRFNVMEGKEVSFEKRWSERESKLKEFPGFMGFYLQRRDALKADDGYNYISSSFWKDRPSFDNWRNSQNQGEQHGSGHGSTAGGSSVGGDLNGRPSVCFYEGKLALASPLGA